MSDRSRKRQMKDEEARIREEAAETSTPDALAEQMRRDMESKSPGQAIKDDLKAIGEDLKDNLSGDADDEDRQRGR